MFAVGDGHAANFKAQDAPLAAEITPVMTILVSGPTVCSRHIE